MEPIRLLIVEDDPDWLRGLTDYLNRQGDINVVECCSTVESARLLLTTTEALADVVLMDIMLQNEPDGHRARGVGRYDVGRKVIMLTSMEEKELIFPILPSRGDRLSNKISLRGDPWASSGLHMPVNQPSMRSRRTTTGGVSQTQTVGDAIQDQRSS